MDKLKILIVDDEKRIRTSLKHIIQIHYPNAEVKGEAQNIQEALDIIHLLKIDVILLDIKMPGGTGFDLLKQLMPVKYKVIFITAFDEFAIKAFRFSALDYLLKPVVPNELVAALKKANDELNEEIENIKLKAFIDNIKNEDKSIVLNTLEESHVVNINQIIRCEADRNYTRFFIINKKAILVSGCLKEYEETLNNRQFYRPHQSHLINLSYVNRLEKHDSWNLILKDGSKIPVATRKHNEILEVLKTPISKF
jgi:two-component system LytT family response regulator